MSFDNIIWMFEYKYPRDHVHIFLPVSFFASVNSLLINPLNYERMHSTISSDLHSSNKWHVLFIISLASVVLFIFYSSPGCISSFTTCGLPSLCFPNYFQAISCRSSAPISAFRIFARGSLRSLRMGASSQLWPSGVCSCTEGPVRKANVAPLWWWLQLQEVDRALSPCSQVRLASFLALKKTSVDFSLSFQPSSF